jgi:hypothetical protein
MEGNQSKVEGGIIKVVFYGINVYICHLSDIYNKIE